MDSSEKHGAKAFGWLDFAAALGALSFCLLLQLLLSGGDEPLQVRELRLYCDRQLAIADLESRYLRDIPLHSIFVGDDPIGKAFASSQCLLSFNKAAWRTRGVSLSLDAMELLRGRRISAKAEAAWLALAKEISGGKPAGARAEEFQSPWLWLKTVEALAAKSGDSALAEECRAELERRQGRLLLELSVFLGLAAALAAVGFLALLWLLWIRCGREALAIGRVPPAEPWSAGRGVLGVFAGAFAALLTGLLPSPEWLAYLLPSLPLAWLLAFYAICLLPFKADFLDFSGLRLKPGSKARLLLLAFAATLVATAGESALSALVGVDGSDLQNAHGIFTSGRAWDLLCAAIGAVIMAPFLEELLFRGVIYPAFKRAMPALPAALLASFIFSALHGYTPDGAAILLFDALLLCLLYEISGTIWCGVLAHALMNLLAALGTFLQL